MAEGTPCPTDVQFLALIDGTLPDERQASLAAHLEACEACRQRLASLAGQSQVIPPEIAPLSDSLPHSDALAAVMHRLKSDTADPEEKRVEERTGTPRLEFLRPSTNPRYLGRLGEYGILDVIGRGGMGTVLKARDAKLERLVAVKVLNPDLAASGLPADVFVDRLVGNRGIDDLRLVGRQLGKDSVQVFGEGIAEQIEWPLARQAHGLDYWRERFLRAQFGHSIQGEQTSISFQPLSSTDRNRRLFEQVNQTRDDIGPTKVGFAHDTSWQNAVVWRVQLCSDRLQTIVSDMDSPSVSRSRQPPLMA